MDVRILSHAQVRELLDLGELVDALQIGFGDLSRGALSAPGRSGLTRPGGSFLLTMAGHRPGGPMTVKVVTLFEENAAAGLPSHLATIALYDADTGACRAFLDGTYITAARTAAAAAVSARLLAREDARVLTVIGAGVQGEHHLRALPLVRDFAEIRVVSSHRSDAERLAALDPRAEATDDPQAAVRDADVIALATSAAEAVIAPEWVAPGTHVTSVGYHPPRGELPPALLADASLFVETRLAFEPPPVGCAELAGLDPATGTELGEVVLATRPGRRRADEITVYKAMGHVIEDIVAAELTLAAAIRAQRGTVIALGPSAGGPTPSSPPRRPRP